MKVHAHMDPLIARVPLKADSSWFRFSNKIQQGTSLGKKETAPDQNSFLSANRSRSNETVLESSHSMERIITSAKHSWVTFTGQAGPHVSLLSLSAPDTWSHFKYALTRTHLTPESWKASWNNFIVIISPHGPGSNARHSTKVGCQKSEPPE